MLYLRGDYIMKKSIIAVIVMLVIATSLFLMHDPPPLYDYPTESDGIKTSAYIDGDEFYINADGTYEKSFLKGVNIGATKPGYFPGSLAISKEEYLRWFEYVSDMNANTIRVYTTMKPFFRPH